MADVEKCSDAFNPIKLCSFSANIPERENGRPTRNVNVHRYLWNILCFVTIGTIQELTRDDLNSFPDASKSSITELHANDSINRGRFYRRTQELRLSSD